MVGITVAVYSSLVVSLRAFEVSRRSLGRLAEPDNEPVRLSVGFVAGCFAFDYNEHSGRLLGMHKQQFNLTRQQYT